MWNKYQQYSRWIILIIGLIIIPLFLSLFYYIIIPQHVIDNQDVHDSTILSQDIALESHHNANELSNVKDTTYRTKVLTQKFEVSYFNYKIHANGYAKPIYDEVIYAQTPVHVIDIMVKAGDLVKRGDLLVELGSSISENNIKATKLNLESAQINYQTMLDLYKEELTSRLSLLKAEIDLNRVKADLRNLMDNTKHVLSPIEGVVNAIYIQKNEALLPKDKIIRIVDWNKMIVNVYLSAKSIPWINNEANVIVDDLITDQKNNKIMAISSVADSDTGMFRIDIEIDNPHDNYLNNYVDVLLISQPIKSHLINSNLIVFDKNENPGVYVLTKGNVANFVPVEILTYDFEGLRVLGLPDNVVLIVNNLLEVVSGNPVEVILQK